MSSDKIIYLDHAAATPMDELVYDSMKPYFMDVFFNPSSPYAPAVKLRRAIDQSRHAIASTLGARQDEIIMTAGATESINLAMTASKDGHVVTSSIEHDSVLQAASQYDNTIVAVDEKGVVSLDSIKRSIKPDTKLVSIALANHEIGTIQPMNDIAAIVIAERQKRIESGDPTPIWLHSDVSQGVGQLDINVARRKFDMMTLNGAKIYGPKQTGILYVKPQVELSSIIKGGGQEKGLRSGTENVANIIGFSKALKIADKGRSAESKRLRELRDMAEKIIIDNISDVVISGSKKKRLPGSLHVSFPGIDAERLVFLLDAKNILVATGSACAANKGTRSHVLEAIGLKPDVADGSIRISLGKLNDTENIKQAAHAIVEAVNSEKSRMKR